MRLVQSKPRPSWLGAKAKGSRVSEVAPPRIFALRPARRRRVQTSEGSFRIKPLDDALPLGAVPLGKATPAIKAALRGFARGEQFEQWTVGKQRAVLNTAICAKDDLPQPSAVDLTSYLPFLRLGWAAPATCTDVACARLPLDRAWFAPDGGRRSCGSRLSPAVGRDALPFAGFLRAVERLVGALEEA